MEEIKLTNNNKYKIAIIIRYSEIYLKGNNRNYFESVLKNNIIFALNELKQQYNINYSCTYYRARYCIQNINNDDIDIIIKKLQNIPGIYNISIAYITDSIIENIIDCISYIIDNSTNYIIKQYFINLKEKTKFKIHTKRAYKDIEMSSLEISSLVGGKILNKYKNFIVDLNEYDIQFNIDIREYKTTFIYTKEIQCIGGLPVGVSGKGLLLLSGGIDSPVAGYLAQKRGMEISCVYFHSYPYTGIGAQNKVEQLAQKLRAFYKKIDLYIVSVTEIQELIHQKCDNKYLITILRRFMLRIAEKIANTNNIDALITGENLGQVASQTIEGLKCSSDAINMLILKPLLCYDKNDIIKIAKHINTYDISIQPYEDCCTVFVPKHPIIKPNIDDVHKIEQSLNIEELIGKAINNIKIIHY